MSWIIKHKILILAVIFSAAAVFYFAGLNGSFPVQEDSAIYITKAKNIAGCLNHGLFGAQVALRPYYPPVYSWIIAPVVYLLPRDYFALKLLSALLALVLLFVVFLAGKKFFHKDLAIPVLALFALSPQIAFYSRSILTEIPYTLFSLLSLYFFIRYEDKESPERIYFFAAVLAALLTFYTRIIGVSLLISIALFLFLKGKLKKAVLFCGVCALGLAPWIWSNLISARSDYISEFSVRTLGVTGFIGRWVYNLCATVGKELPDLFFSPFLAQIDPSDKLFVYKFIVGLLLAVFILAGFLLKIKKEGWALTDLYVAVYSFMFYLSWTHHGARYLVPVLAFLLYYFLLGIKGASCKPGLFYPLIILFVCLAVAGNLKAISGEKHSPFTPAEESFIRSVDWLESNVSRDSVVISRYPYWILVYTNGIRGMKFIKTVDPKEQYSYILKNKADYLIIDQNKIYRDDSRDYLLPLVERYKEGFEKVYSGAGPVKTFIYRVKK
ncbi:MAG: glycosyltransferase family 39 protein [Candidatus Omnitrophica bacterium]|nr:glycosyltransferase family 39 protein [Candidatus Omnitrophota bacterium]